MNKFKDEWFPFALFLSNTFRRPHLLYVCNTYIWFLSSHAVDISPAFLVHRRWTSRQIQTETGRSLALALIFIVIPPFGSGLCQLDSAVWLGFWIIRWVRFDRSELMGKLITIDTCLYYYWFIECVSGRVARGQNNVICRWIHARISFCLMQNTSINCNVFSMQQISENDLRLSSYNTNLVSVQLRIIEISRFSSVYSASKPGHYCSYCIRQRDHRTQYQSVEHFNRYK